MAAELVARLWTELSTVPWAEPQRWWQWLETSDALVAALVFCGLFAVHAFFSGEVTGNYSAVDRMWSIVPGVYVCIFTLKGNGSLRSYIMCLLTLTWGLRLSYNFWRKGGYNGEEDYRWAKIREKINNRLIMTLFNISFIATYQHALLLAFVLPAYVVASAEGPANTPLQLTDYVATALFLAMFVLEIATDEQQWRFQSEKHRKINAKEPLTGDYKRGFSTTGLFRFSRHLNFFAEQSMWWYFYLFTVGVTGQWLHWSITGTILLTLLFQGSTQFTEEITLAKYKDYSLYQATTSRLIPWLPGPPLDARSD